MELIGTAGVAGATARLRRRAVDGGEHSYLVDGSPGAAVRAAPDPFRGDVVALRTAVLRTRLGHGVTVSAVADRSLVMTARVAALFVGRVACRVAARCLARRDRHRDGDLARLLEIEGEVVGQAVGDGLVDVDRGLRRVGGLSLPRARRPGRRARRRLARHVAGREVSPVSDTVPKSEVIEVSLSAVSGDSLDATNSSSTSPPGCT